ncbi:hypothetical protein [Rummeliibacillus pycnus]|uniref:hypothetical protein n=1 Tax=Rummeliibacillus pycnus TaxID=101070 RepID=UPI003D2AB4A1
MKHQVTILDYAFHESITCFIKIQGFDGINEQPFNGMIRMVDGVPYGDIIKEEKSNLSSDCIQYIKVYIYQKYEQGFFS